ncbi:helix-turn-helix transcriptional regulator [Gracilibacillus xinjiangensis]|uniref:Helix-turn-helix transcriptional regulator n=1 Tax=Gracilibacillus xinjiangensis TaxID=1193282 RepID=A0ABV8WZ42_9BACI
MTYTKEIHTKLRSLREENGLKSMFVAKKLGVTPSTYSEIETGKRLPQVKHLVILRNLYNITIDELFFDNNIANCDYDERQEVCK